MDFFILFGIKIYMQKKIDQKINNPLQMKVQN